MEISRHINVTIYLSLLSRAVMCSIGEKINLKGELFPHRVHDCPAKNSGIVGNVYMPADFAALDFPRPARS